MWHKIFVFAAVLAGFEPDRVVLGVAESAFEKIQGTDPQKA